MKKIVIIIHGHLSWKDHLKKKITDLLEHNFIIEFQLTKASHHATALACDAATAGCDFLIAVGGDGTMNEVINGMMQTSEKIRAKTIVGLLPSGTGNDFARTVGIKKSVEKLAELIEKGESHPVDVGVMTFTGLDGVKITRYFNNISDIGIGGQVVALVKRSKMFFGASLAFGLALFRTLLWYRNKHAKIVSPNFTWEGQVISMCLANGKYFGSGIGIAPDAKVDDGIISLVIIGNVSVIDYLKYLPKLRNCERIQHPEIHYREITQCTIESADADCHIDMDGEYIGHPPIEMHIIKHAVQFLRS